MKSSFTLIELLVVIGIVILLTIGSIAGISASRQKREVKATAEKLRSTIANAIALAQHPEDTDFGLQKIQVRVYPHDLADGNLANRVKVYKVATTESEVTGLSFKAPKGVYLDTSNVPPQGNMSCVPANCSSYYYFNVASSGNQLGQLVDINPGTFEVYLTVAGAATPVSGEDYKVKVFQKSGLVTVEKF